MGQVRANGSAKRSPLFMHWKSFIFHNDIAYLTSLTDGKCQYNLSFGIFLIIWIFIYWNKKEVILAIFVLKYNTWSQWLALHKFTVLFFIYNSAVLV